jgi:hypothetical protein
MSVPELILPEECLTAPTRFHPTEIEFMMLWPHDPEMREIARKAALVELWVGHLSGICG